MIVNESSWLVAVSEFDSCTGVMASPRESITPRATTSEVKTDTKALTF